MFHAIVGHYVGCGWDLKRILAHLEQHPEGIGSRYLAEGRLGDEIARSAGKYAQTELPLGGNGGWTPRHRRSQRNRHSRISRQRMNPRSRAQR